MTKLDTESEAVAGGNTKEEAEAGWIKFNTVRYMFRCSQIQ